MIGESFYTALGGKGANQAVACARMGADVRMVGRVGKDEFGPALVGGLRRHGIDADNASGIAIILLDSNSQNHIVAVYGANAACDNAQLEDTKRALEGADALLLQMEVPIEVSLAAAQYARSRGVLVVWDPAPARPLPAEAYAAIDVLTPNQTEATFLAGVEVSGPAAAAEVAEILRGRGAAAVVVKLGEQGVYYATADESGFVEPFEVEAVDTVAAGDAFGGALAVALSKGMSMRDAVRYGAAAGALAVTRAGAQEAMPARHEVDAMLAGGGA